MKNKFFKNFTYSILAVLFCTANFAYAQNSNILTMKTVAVKFTLAMLGVGLFSILIYIGLSLYNRFFVAPQIKDSNLNRDSLHTPRDVDDAVMTFITKNRLK